MKKRLKKVVIVTYKITAFVSNIVRTCAALAFLYLLILFVIPPHWVNIITFKTLPTETSITIISPQSAYREGDSLKYRYIYTKNIEASGTIFTNLDNGEQCLIRESKSGTAPLGEERMVERELKIDYSCGKGNFSLLIRFKYYWLGIMPKEYIIHSQEITIE